MSFKFGLGSCCGCDAEEVTCLIAEDLFDRADEEDVTGWDDTGADDVALVSNKLVIDAADTYATYGTDSNYYSHNVVVQANGTTSGDILQVIVKWLDDDNYLFVEFEFHATAGKVRFYARESGTSSQVGSEHDASDLLAPGSDATITVCVNLGWGMEACISDCDTFYAQESSTITQMSAVQFARTAGLGSGSLSGEIQVSSFQFSEIRDAFSPLDPDDPLESEVCGFCHPPDTECVQGGGFGTVCTTGSVPQILTVDFGSGIVGETSWSDSEDCMEVNCPWLNGSHELTLTQLGVPSGACFYIKEYCIDIPLDDCDQCFLPSAGHDRLRISIQGNLQSDTSTDEMRVTISVYWNCRECQLNGQFAPGGTSPAPSIIHTYGGTSTGGDTAPNINCLSEFPIVCATQYDPGVDHFLNTEICNNMPASVTVTAS